MNKVNFQGCLLLSSLLLTLMGCSAKPKVQLAPENARLLETKAQIKNADESYNVKIQVAVWPNKAVRMEVSATLGLSVASVLITPQQIKIVLPSQKTYIRGPFAERTLYPVFKQNISPRLIWKIIHDQNPADQKLTCQLNAVGKPTSCLHADGSTINWIYNEPPSRKVDIKRNQFEMTWIFKDELALPHYQNETFVLNKPDAYKEIVIK